MRNQKEPICASSFAKNGHEPLYTQDQEIAQKDLEIRVLKNNEDCRENIEIMENLFTEIDEAKDQLERKNHESTILKKELARRIKENIFNKEEIVKKTEKIENQDEIIAMNDKKIAKMDQEIAKMDQEIAKKAKQILEAFFEHQEEMMK